MIFSKNHIRKVLFADFALYAKIAKLNSAKIY